ncbi:MAG: DNA polymerase III subunit delta' [Hyphomicrobium sp.]|nr:DNA polymerase III subunit delta' [Hyphomicrobium sp.]
MARAPTAPEIEDLPESDCLEGFPHPRETRALYGYGSAEATFLEAFSSGRMHHAWLLVGPPGIGKATFAYRAARHVLAPREARDPFGRSLDIDPDERTAHLIAGQAHPELVVIRRPYDLKTKKFKSEIIVEEVRRLRSSMVLSRDPDQWRVVIIDAADDLNISAANALLKSLEEPPPRTLYLLIATSARQILPTIRSRCRVLLIRSLATEDFRRAVTQALGASHDTVTATMPTADQWSLLERLSGGSVRQALSLHAASGLDLYNRICQLLSGLPSLDWAAVHALGDDLSSPASETRFELFETLLLGLLSRAVRQTAEGSATANPDAPADGALETALTRTIVGPGPLAPWAQLWETLVADKAEAAALNLDRKALILSAFQRIEAAARRSRAA